MNRIYLNIAGLYIRIEICKLYHKDKLTQYLFNSIKIIYKSINLLKAKGFTKRRISGLYIYQVQFASYSLKIDFSSFPNEPVETGIRYHKLWVDSFYDIAINKLYTILSRFQTRDFIDLYFILQKNEFSLEQLISRVEDKFKTIVDPLYLSSQLLRAVDLPKAIPIMLKPFDFSDMVDYFKKSARSLQREIIK